MFLQLTTDTELGHTMSADVRVKRPTARVTQHVFPKVLGARKCLRTGRASVRLVAVVQLDVSPKVPDARKQNTADSAAELHHAVDVADVVRLGVLHIGGFHYNHNASAHTQI